MDEQYLFSCQQHPPPLLLSNKNLCLLAVFHIVKDAVLCYLGDGPLVMRVHAYLERFGYINFGVFKRLKPLPGNTFSRITLNLNALNVKIIGFQNQKQNIFFVRCQEMSLNCVDVFKTTLLDSKAMIMYLADL